jgi:hypothetical protein
MTTILSLLLCAAMQSASAKPGDLLLRPMIPDPMLLRQTWAQQELGLSASEIDEIQKETSSQQQSFQDLGRRLALQGKFDQFKPKPLDFAFKLAAINRVHAKRLYELSVQVNGVLSLLDPKVAGRVGLSASQRSRIDQIVRDFYTWHDNEWKRLNGWSRFDRNPSAEARMNMSHPLRTPDEFISLKRTMLVRGQIRGEVTREQMKRLTSLGGKPVHTTTPIGFTLNIAPYAQLPYGAGMLLNWPRTHEELGMSMKQSRLLFEKLKANQGRTIEVLDQERKRLSTSQRKRLRGLELQVAGPRAILWHDVQAELGVDPDRMDQCYLALHKLHLENMKMEDGFQLEFQALNRLKPYPFEEDKKLRARMDGRRREMEARMDATAKQAMAPEQLKRLKQMQGERVDGLLPEWARQR